MNSAVSKHGTKDAMAITTAIRDKYNTLSPVQKVVADFILQEAEHVPLLSLVELAQRCETSETTVMRFLRKIGIDSFQLFKVRLAREVTKASDQDIYEEIGHEDTTPELIRKVVVSTTNALGDIKNTLNPDHVTTVVKLLRTARRIMFVGLGSSGLVAADAFYKFAKIGLDVSAHQDPYSISIIGSQATPADLFVAISHTGETREILTCLELAKSNGAKVVSLTSHVQSSIAKYSDVVLKSSTNDVKYLPDATVSRLIQLVIIDILYVELYLQLLPESAERVQAARLAIARNKT